MNTASAARPEAAAMHRRNRVDPFGDLHAVEARGMFTGNRGCLVDDSRQLARHHAGNLWIICETSFRGWRHPLDAPRRWTPLFFLDDAVGLAAGHRPCALCRREQYRSYRDAVAASIGDEQPIDDANNHDADNRSHSADRNAGYDRNAGGDVRSNASLSAAAINRRLAGERLARGSGLVRGGDRLLWHSPVDDLPDGAVIVDGARRAHLVVGDRMMAFGHYGWGPPLRRPCATGVMVLTPPTSVAALRFGFRPVLHPSAMP